jgi:2-oxoisovalerate dehydrogenase E1 component beta subunit
VIDTPLSENGIVGSAVGMALYGMVPIVEIQFADFIWPAYDQIVNELAKYRYRSGGEYPAKLVIRTPVGGGIRGGHYHSQHPESAFISVPGLKVVIPSNPYDAKGLLARIHSRSDPVIFFEPKRVYRAAKGEVPEGDYTVPLESASVVRKGRHATVLAYGAMLYEALDAAQKAAEKGRRSRGHRSTYALARRHRDDSRKHQEDGPARRRARSAEDSRFRRRAREPRSRARVLSSRGSAPSESPASTRRFPYTLEMEYLPLSHRILPAILEVARSER